MVTIDEVIFIAQQFSVKLLYMKHSAVQIRLYLGIFYNNGLYCFPRALCLNIPMYIICVSLFALTGLLLVAYFGECDPLRIGRITRADQVTGVLPNLCTC